MSKKIKCAIITFAMTAVVAASAALSACTIKTDHPQAKITVSFNSKTYEIDYKLYRNMYPQTVQHFIELADAGFYDNTIVHNYKSGSDWFTGAYAYNEEDIGLYTATTFGEYLEKNYKEQEYYDLAADGTLTPSVYSKVSYDSKGNVTVDGADALPTLIGEFSANDHNIENNALTAQLGCLKMFYYDKGDSNKPATIVNSFGQILNHDYRYNCATSVFSMQVGSSTYSATNYCVFAQLKNDSAKTALENLIEAIDDYVTEVGSSKFTTSVTTFVDKLDSFAENGEVEESFAMTSMPIIIKSVKITKY